MASHCSVRLMSGRVVIRMTHSRGALITELTVAEAEQIRDLLTTAILGLEHERPFPSTLQTFIDTFDQTKAD